MAQVTKIASAARATASPVVSPSFALGNARSVIARLIITSAPTVPTGTLVLSVEEYDADAGQWNSVDAAAPASAVGTYELGVDSSALTSDVIRLVVDGTDAQSYTYSVTSEVFVSTGLGYSPPSLTELRAKIARDIRDELMDAFTSSEIDDYINDAITELNLIRPREAISSLRGILDLDSLGMSYIWKVETVAADGTGGSQVIPPNNDETRFMNGWTYFAGRLVLPQKYVDWLDTRFTAGTLRLDVYGYSLRTPLVSDEEIADFDSVDESLVRRYAMTRAYRSLLADRSQFQQWQANANNSDVSPTQLTNMSQVVDAEWNRNRARSYVIRRPPVGW